MALGGRPYTDRRLSENSFIRTFPAGAHIADLEWHRDHNTRTIRVIEGQGWRFQYDNTLPEAITEGAVFTVKKEQYHRLLPGRTDLVLEIQEH